MHNLLIIIIIKIIKIITTTIKPIDVIVDGMIAIVNPEPSNIYAPNPLRPFVNSALRSFVQEENAVCPNNNTIKIIKIITTKIKPIDVIVDGMIALVNPEPLNIANPNPLRPFVNSALRRFRQPGNA